MDSFAVLLYLSVIALMQFVPAVFSPRPGETLQGTIVITGTSNAIGFDFYELTFGYSDDPTQTWFLIAQSDQPVQNDKLAEWDTTAISDGKYSLRLLVFLDDGTSIEVIVPGLIVHNYTLAETPIPTPTVTRSTTVLPIVTPSIAIRTFTPLPFNSAALTPALIVSSAGIGALAAISLLLVLIIYLRARKSRNK